MGSLNGEVPELYKQTALTSPSSRYVWVEENDPRGENVGSWIMNQGNPAKDFVGAQLVDSTANFHGNASTFNYGRGSDRATGNGSNHHRYGEVKTRLTIGASVDFGVGFQAGR